MIAHRNQRFRKKKNRHKSRASQNLSFARQTNRAFSNTLQTISFCWIYIKLINRQYNRFWNNTKIVSGYLERYTIKTIDMYSSIRSYSLKYSQRSDLESDAPEICLTWNEAVKPTSHSHLLHTSESTCRYQQVCRLHTMVKLLLQANK